MTVLWDTPNLDSWRRAGPSAATLRVRDVMSWPAVVIQPDMTTGFATEVAREHDVHHFPVVLHGDLVGVVCTCDLAGAASDEAVAEHMTDHVITVSPGVSLSEAVERMDDHGINCLVTHWRGGFGIITRGDAVRANASSRKVCESCGTGHHVRRHPLYEGQWFCDECIEPRSDPLGHWYDDQGAGD
jgi:CBS domain-containing protein